MATLERETRRPKRNMEVCTGLLFMGTVSTIGPLFVVADHNVHANWRGMVASRLGLKTKPFRL